MILRKQDLRSKAQTQTLGQEWINPALAFDLGVGFGCEPPALIFIGRKKEKKER